VKRNDHDDLQSIKQLKREKKEKFMVIQKSYFECASMIFLTEFTTNFEKILLFSFVKIRE
jgi:hypothetical protein